MKILLLLLLPCVLLAEKTCSRNETSSISIQLNGSSEDVSAVRPKIDKLLKDVEETIKSTGAEQVLNQSYSYNIYNNEDVYNYNGSVSFNVSPASKAEAAYVALMKKGFKGSINYNSYENGTHEVGC